MKSYTRLLLNIIISDIWIAAFGTFCFTLDIYNIHQPSLETLCIKELIAGLVVVAQNAYFINKSEIAMIHEWVRGK